MKLVDYKAPKWLLDHVLFKQIESKIPKKRFNFLNNKPTRIEKLDENLLTKLYTNATNATNYEIWFKRDDLNHDLIYLQGNKLRKLEFIFADALLKSNKKPIHVLTAGGLQSNHARAVAGISNQLNMKAHLFLRSHTKNASELKLNGNLLIDRLLGADIYLIEKRAQYLQSIEMKMKELEQKLLEKYGDVSVYLIPIGGSNLVGLFGYLDAFDEMISQQSIKDKIDDIIITTGSGGTMAALAIANYLTGSHFGLHAFCVCDNSAYFYKHLQDQLEELFGASVVSENKLDSRSMINIVECSRGLGYAKSTRDELDFQIRFIQQTGILIDPVYTGKTIYTLFNLLTRNKPTLAYDLDESGKRFCENLRGNRLLFIHTGGQLGQFENNIYDSLFDSTNNKSKIFDCFNDNTEKLVI